MPATIPTLVAVTATWHLVDEDGVPGPRHDTMMAVQPEQDMVADAPKIVAILLWADARRADEVKVIALRVSHVQT